MKPLAPKTELPPSSQLRKAVFGGSLKKMNTPTALNNRTRLLQLITAASVPLLLALFMATAFNSYGQTTTPQFLWVIQCGGSYSAAVSGTNIAITGGYTPAGSVQTHGYVANYTPDGQLRWDVQIPLDPGHNERVQGTSIVVDAQGNSYVVGHNNGNAHFGTNVLSATVSKEFLAKYDAAGNTLWAKQIFGGPEAYHDTFGLDSAGNIYLAGSLWQTMTFGTNILTCVANTRDAVVAKCDANGNPLWIRWIHGLGYTYEDAYSIAVDSAGNCYVTGRLVGSPGAQVQFGNTTNSTITMLGSGCVFVAKYDSAGNFLWVRQAGSGSASGFQGNSIAVDTLGNCFVTGQFEKAGTGSGAGFVNSFEGQMLTLRGYKDIFLAKYNSSGVFQWVKQAGSGYTDIGSGVALDRAGNCYVGGTFTDLAQFDSVVVMPWQGIDTFIAKYDTAGNVVWVKVVGGTNADVYMAHAVDPTGTVYLKGWCENPGVAFDYLTFGFSGGYLAKLSEYICLSCPPVIISHPLSQTLAEGAQLNLGAVAGGTDPLSYQWYKAGAALVNGGRVSGAVTANLSITGLQESDAGDYWLVVTNNWGAVNSATANLVVTTPVHLLAPTNHQVVVVRRPEFSWSQPNPPATWYHLWLNRNGAKYLEKWVESLTSWTPTQDLPGGTYSWSVQPWNTQGLGGWANTFIFVIPSSPPGPVTLIAPTGGQRVANTRPAFSWSAASPAASWYHLWVNRDNSKYYETWTQNNSWTPSWNLAAGAYSWWVQTWNADGLGSWSTKGDFVVGLPGPVTLLSPINGALETNLTVRYTWTAELAADWYELAIVRNGASFSDRWFSSMHTASNTPAGQFAVEVGGHGSGAYRWWVRAWNTNGLSSWVGPGSFTNTLSVPGIKHLGDTRQPGGGGGWHGPLRVDI